jgi:acetyl-CoA C-acetyltransferase
VVVAGPGNIEGKAKGRAPLVVGCAQRSQRCDDPREALEPLALIEAACRLAAEDCGAPSILADADSIYVTRGLWRYTDPGALLRDRLAASKATTGLASISGSSVQRMVNHAARRIEAGDADVVLVCGGEAEHSKRRARRGGIELSWTQQADALPDELFGSDEVMIDPFELEIGLTQPAATFTLFDNALRHARGESHEEHRRRISQLWAGLAAVARDNPNAWSRDGPTADEIGRPSEDNALVAHPYTKRLCSNMVVDQAAALIVCSEVAADRLGIAPSKRVFIHAGSEVERTPLVSERADYVTAPFHGRAGRRALELAGCAIHDIAHIDLYSCFPAAVQLGMAELGISADRDLTVCGGLAYAGGPFNSYVLHSTAAMVDRLRANPGDLGLVTSVGGWMAKHGFGIYSTRRPEQGFAYASLDDEVDDIARREVVRGATGPAEVETYALRYVGGKPSALLVACLMGDGRRAWTRTDEQHWLDSVTSAEFCGRVVALRDGELE